MPNNSNLIMKSMVLADDPANPVNLDTYPNSAKFTAGDVTFELFSALFLWLLVPGCGFFYSGLGRSHDALTMVMTSFWSIAIVSVQWWLVGYSLVFSRSANWFIGNFRNSFLIGVWDRAYDGENTKFIPELVFCVYQGVTACLGPSLILGVIAGRGRMLPAIIFVCVWTTLVYDVVASWSLNPRGWSAKMGDFGGGSPVHVPSAAAALAYTLLLGPREIKLHHEHPHNMINIVIGTVFIWVGSFGYSPGSAFAANMVAVSAAFNANLAGSAGAITWALMDFWKHGHWSANGFCCGAVVGLVAITPGSGFVSPTSSFVYGTLTAVLANFGLRLKNKFKFDDTLDVFVMHGTSGLVGNILTGILAQRAYGGHTVGKGGCLDGHWFQVVYQLVDTTATFLWSFIISYITLYLMNKTKTLKLRVSRETELYQGLDKVEMGIQCYEFVHGTISPTHFGFGYTPRQKGLFRLEKLKEVDTICENEIEEENNKNIRVSIRSSNNNPIPMTDIPIGINYNNWFNT